MNSQDFDRSLAEWIPYLFWMFFKIAFAWISLKILLLFVFGLIFTLISVISAIVMSTLITTLFYALK
jgi:hypothetical protein